jgi:transposase-like protein
MAGEHSQEQRAPRGRWSLAEKRRIVELALRANGSVRAFAHEQGVNPTNLNRWKTLYRAGKLDARAHSSRRVPEPAASATFVPVSVIPEMRNPKPAARPDAASSRSSVVQLVLASGATLRIEAGALDVAMVCALVAELQR